MKIAFLILFFIFWNQRVLAQNDTGVLKKLSAQVESDNRQITQLNNEVAELKRILQKQRILVYEQYDNASQFMDAAVSSANNLQSLISKESYRNKITSLNNPTSGELGFKLETEIEQSLKPLLNKTKKTDVNKFQQIVKGLVEAGQNTTSLFPAGNIFTCLLSLVGNVAVNEKNIQKEDVDNFIRQIEKYFNQYEKLYECNIHFNNQMQVLKNKMKIIQEDIKVQLQDIVLSLDKNVKRDQLSKINPEELLLKYFNRKYISDLEAKNYAILFPNDAVKSCKEIAIAIKRTYDEYALIYNENFKAISTIINNMGSVSATIDKVKVNRTFSELEILFAESKNIDADNLRLKTLFERLEFMQH